jgi:nucleotidyltransferase/DNA polymerase involved in DNA repair
MTRILCGLAPHLQLAIRPHLYGRPVVVATWEAGVVCASDEAQTAGVVAGLTHRQAEQLCPAAEIVPPDAEAAERLRRRLAAALYDVTPVVEIRTEGIAFLRLDGLPDPGHAIREARRRLQDAAAVPPRLGLAPGPFSARLAAAWAAPGRLVEVKDVSSFLAPISVVELGLEPELLERLDLLGLRTLGDVARLGPRALETQLGPPGRRAAALAQGLEPDGLDPWRPPEVTGTHRQLEPPVEDREALLFIARGLCDELGAELGLRGAGARRVRVNLELDRRLEPVQRETLVRHPLSSSRELFGLVSGWLRGWEVECPVAGIAVELPELEPFGRRQLRLWVGGDGSGEEVEAALERLQERFGEDAAVRPRPALLASAVPAQRFRLEPH